MALVKTAAAAAGLVLLAANVASAATTDVVTPKYVCDPRTATIIKTSLLQQLMVQNKVFLDATSTPDLTPGDIIAAYADPAQLKQLKSKNTGLEELEFNVAHLIKGDYPSFAGSNKFANASDYLKPNSTVTIKCTTMQAAASQPQPASPAGTQPAAPSTPQTGAAVGAQPSTPSTPTANTPQAPASKPFSIAANDPSNPLPDPLKNIRVRGTADDLIFNESDVRYNSASKTSVSFSDNGTSKTRTDQMQSAIGAAFNFGSEYLTVVPYIAGNRNVSFVPSKPEKVAVNTADTGVSVQYETDPIIPGVFDGPPGHFIVSVRPDYLKNFDSGARLLTANGLVVPYLPGVLNDPRSLMNIWCHLRGLTADECPSNSGWPYISALADARLDIGEYDARGNTTPQINENYTRLGSKFGIDINNNSWYDLTITHTYLHGFSGYYPDLNYFLAQLTFNVPGAIKNLGLTTSYQNGRVEATALRTQMWSVALTAKF